MSNEQSVDSDAEAPAQSGDSAVADAENLDEQVRVRREKLAALRDQGDAYTNDFRPTATCGDLTREFDGLEGPDVEAKSDTYRVAGRVLAVRSFGKTIFLGVRDGTGKLQFYIRKQDVDEDLFQVVKKLDVGDIVGATGPLFVTKTGELTLRVGDLRLLVKGLRPLPEKWHGLADVETRYRQRYVDLIVNENSREVFRRRSMVVGGIRSFLQTRGFIEVETPMMQTIPGGAAAKPFTTHHNALSLDMYLRIAPELYLKRLVVGGFDRVFELNRNFRNEGISTEHNPEFTMCEFYQAYARYDDLMALTEEMFAELATAIHGGTSFSCGDKTISFKPPFERLTMGEAVAKYSRLTPDEAESLDTLTALADELGIDTSKRKPGLGLLSDVFDEIVEHHLEQPTFITSFPVEVSPLARASRDKPGFVDRFELFIDGKEIANGFSELNDPDEQFERFSDQLSQREAGDEEAHMMDEDYIRALEYGLPPTAGEGIGVDRLVMLLAGVSSIREVILFPHLKPERRR